MVEEVREKEIVLQNGEVVPYGICVWYVQSPVCRISLYVTTSVVQVHLHDDAG